MGAPTTAPALRVGRLAKRYGACQALDGADLVVHAGETAALVGANGAGKTTLLKCVLDLVRPDAGQVEIFGVPNRNPVSRARIAYLPERFSPPYYLKGREFIEMTLALGGNRYERTSAERQLAELDLDPAVLDRSVRELSKGMTQKLGIAASLLAERDLYILDEPMSGLDPASRIAVKSALARLRHAGRAVFFSSHVLADVEELCSALIVLDRGSVRFHAAPAALCERYAEPSLERAYLKCIQEKK
jgi:ABC-2 type transport system ATP-binding protein